MELCGLLPWWEAWLGPVLGAFFGVGTTVALLEFLRVRSVKKLEKAASAHWSERAIIGLESKILVLSVGVAGTMISTFLIIAWKSGSGCSPPSAVLSSFGLLVVASMFRALGAIAAAYRGPQRSVLERLRSIATFLIVLYPVLLVVFIANLTGELAPSDGSIWVFVGVVAVLHVVSCTGLVYGLARPLGLTWPARDTVRNAVERAQGDMPTKVQKVDELAWLMPNAVALPLQGIVAFTKIAADEMTEDELHAIALHELGHLREPPLVRWMRPARGLLFLPFSVGIPLMVGGHSTALIVVVVCCFVFGFATRGFSRRHEAKADAHGAAHSPAYARALEKLHRLAGIPAVISKQATHPSLYDRMLEAGVTPDFPRPRAPNQIRPLLSLAPVPFLMVGFIVIAFSLKGGLLVGDRERAALLAVAIQGTPEDLLALARETSDEHLAKLLYERAIKEDPTLAPKP